MAPIGLVKAKMGRVLGLKVQFLNPSVEGLNPYAHENFVGCYGTLNPKQTALLF